MRRLPTIVLLGLVCFACPQPKAGDDRLPGDASTNDSGTPDPTDGGSASDGGSTPDGGQRPDGGAAPDATPDGGSPPEDAGDPNCVPSGPEDCSNGIDDDCQNGADCADPVCGVCVPVPNGFTVGLMVETEASCPPGFEAQAMSIFADLDPGQGCAGTCQCTPNPTRCLGELYIYSTPNQCQSDASLTGGQLYSALIDENCTAMPVQEGFPGGYRLGNWTIQQSCTAAGVAAPSPYTWGQQMKFCFAQVGLQGCDASSVCFAAPEQACLIASGGAACPDPFSNRMTQWFSGLSDTRSCGACACSAAGGSCQFAQISLGSDWVCTDDAAVSQQSPTSCGSAYSPPARVTGFPGDPTCTPSSQQTGSIEATGQQTICCMP